MARDILVDLGEHFSAFVDSRVEQGRYGSVSEVVSAGLQLLEQEEARIELIRAAIIEGEESGYPESFDFDEFLARMRREHER